MVTTTARASYLTDSAAGHKNMERYSLGRRRHPLSRAFCCRWILIFAAAGLLGHNAGAKAKPSQVHISPAPTGEPLSKDFTVAAEGTDVPVYLAKVAPGDDLRRWKEMDDVEHSGSNADHASFAPLDISGPVTIVITCLKAVHGARVLPSSYQIEPKIDNSCVTFTLTEPRNLTLEVNGDAVHSLHLFASPFEAAAPMPGDPGVIYFGPGIHLVRQGIKVSSGKMLYLAGGAVLRGVYGSVEPVVTLAGDHVALRGRGIIDGSSCPPFSRQLLAVRGRDVAIEGVILHDSSHWTLPIQHSERVTVTNLKILGCRANSDGIDICNSRNVTVDNCFVRTLDDLIVVKSPDKGAGPVRHVVVKNCVLWNQVAHALSIGAELRENVDDVLFAHCDIIHDTGREWLLRVYHCDGATVNNVRFEDIRIEESRRLISLWIGSQKWSRDPERGHIHDVTFKNIRAISPLPPQINLTGFDAAHAVDDVTFENVVVNGNRLSANEINTNEFVKQVSVKP